jgi:hypothetical protein
MRMGMRNGMVWRLVDDCLVIRYDTPGIQENPELTINCCRVNKNYTHVMCTAVVFTCHLKLIVRTAVSPSHEQAIV